MAFMDSIQKAAQDLSHGFKEVTDGARLNALVGKEERLADDLYRQLGKLCYEAGGSEGDGDEMKRLRGEIDAANERIAKLNEEANTAKAAQQAPPPASAAFCVNCGARVSPGSNFCTTCGQKL